MNGLNSLKDIVAQKKKEVRELVGDKKYVKRIEIEAAQLSKIKEEEAREMEEKGKKRRLNTPEETRQDSTSGKKADEVEETPFRLLPKDEVIRRLRALGQPITLFGEEDVDRMLRMMKAEEFRVEDDTRGGQQENIFLEMSRQKRQAKAAGTTGTSGMPEQAAAAQLGEQQHTGSSSDAQCGSSNALSTSSNPGDVLLASFQAAAAKLAEQRAEEAMAVEDRIAKYLKRWSQEWQEDLDQRSEEVKKSGPGKQHSLTYLQTMKYLEPLYDQLRHRSVDGELLTGLWMMVKAMRERNYLHANDVYLRLAIGNAPWPIGVTSVGIHERSAREKISHAMNAHSAAHIMNDEATRKYLQALKRTITFLQRIYPTDPSRSVDFNTIVDPGRGLRGGGSDKLALIEAARKGEDLTPAPAPHYLEKDGSVQVPPKWQNMLAREAAMGGVNGINGRSIIAQDSGKSPSRHYRENTPPLRM